MRRFFLLSLIGCALLAVGCQRAPVLKPEPTPSPPPVRTGRVADFFPGPGATTTTSWTEAEALVARLKLPAGFSISVFAVGLAKPRQAVFAPDGTLLVADLERGAVYALPDADGDGRADRALVVLDRLDFPNSLALHHGYLYIAVKDGVYRSRYDAIKFTAAKPEKIVSLPARPDIRHQTRTVAVGPDEKLYITVASTCDVCVEIDPRYASMLHANLDGSEVKIFSPGLRNTVYFAFDRAGRMWGNDMGQDDLGDDLPPDELNLIQEGRHYGWPYCYGNRVIGTLASSTFACRESTPPAHAYTAHAAPLGIAFIPSSAQFPAAWQGDAVVALHGSWNIEPPVGYKVVRLEMSGGRVVKEHDLVTGWLEYVPGENSAGTSPGRPAYVAFDAAGALYVVDDKAGAIFRMTRKSP